jgi:FkbM family methyltransferase
MSVRDSIRALREVTSHPLNAGRGTSAVVDYLRWNVGHRIVRAEYILPLADQASVIITDQENFGTLAYTCALWDFEEMLFLTHLLRPVDLFLDIGANVGGYTVLASAVAGARSMAFEPVPATHDRLLRNIRLNRIEDRARGFQLGIADVDRTLLMTADRGGLNHIISGQWAGATVEVPVRRLDDVLDNKPCRLIKLDTEGFEMNVLRGGTSVFGNPNLLALIVELNGSGDRYGNTDDAVHAEILRYGFAPYRYDPATRQLSRLETFNQDSLNTLYVRDLDATSQIVASGRKVRVRDREF